MVDTFCSIYGEMFAPIRTPSRMTREVNLSLRIRGIVLEGQNSREVHKVTVEIDQPAPNKRECSASKPCLQEEQPGELQVPYAGYGPGKKHPSSEEQSLRGPVSFTFLKSYHILDFKMDPQWARTPTISLQPSQNIQRTRASISSRRDSSLWCHRRKRGLSNVFLHTIKLLRFFLSPNILPFYKDDSGNSILPLPKLLEGTGTGEKEKDKILELIMEASGWTFSCFLASTGGKKETLILEGGCTHFAKVFNADEVNLFTGANEIVEDAFRISKNLLKTDLGKDILEISTVIEKSYLAVQKSFSHQQKKDLSRRKYTFLDKDQLHQLYGENGCFSFLLELWTIWTYRNL